MTNYTAGHETRCRELGDSRLDYPDYHIESDNRLSWFLGRLDQKYGDNAVYVHLYRNPQKVAESYDRRWTYPGTIVLSHTRGVLKSHLLGIDPCIDYVRTVTENIQMFLKDKKHVFSIDIDDPKHTFTNFWNHISAAGNLEYALGEFNVHHNVSFLNPEQPTDEPTLGNEKDKVIFQLERIMDMFHQEREELFAQQQVAEKRINKLLNKVPDSKQIEIEREASAKLQTKIDKVENSVSYRLARTIVKNIQSPRGWIRMPFDIGKLCSQYLREKKNRKVKKTQGSQHRVIFETAQLEEKYSSQHAIEFLQKHGTTRDRFVSNLFKANASTDNDAIWTNHVNSYLEQFDVAPIALRPGEDKRFHRLAAATGYKIDQGPKVSVIMPVYNAEGTLTQAASSILNQTWQNIELIIIDDASSDNTWEMITSLAAKDDRVKALRNSINVGPYISKNLALDHVTGTYLTGQDGDDWSHPQRIERHLAAMTATPKVKASLAYMIRATEQVKFSSFCVLGKTSFDGAARLCSISALFEVETFKNQLGYWDSVRFGADSELIERARISFGPKFQTVKLVTMICLDIEGSLTNHPTHGVRPNGGGLSPIRSSYREHWMQWHKSIDSQSSYLDFPHSKRRFSAPKDMLVESSDIDLLKLEMHKY
jgi:glycosyltransferase involved in cell wall biosynthesis